MRSMASERVVRMAADATDASGAGGAGAPRRYEDLPGPRGVPLLGNLLQIETSRMHRQLERWCAEFGPTYRLRLGKRRAIVFTDHEAVAAILRDRPDGFRRTTRLDQIWTEMGLQRGVFGASGDEWRRQRRMVMAAFDPAHVKAYFPSLQGVAASLAARWERAAQAGTPIDLQEDLMRFTVDTIAGLAFGTRVDTLEADDDVIQRHLNRLFPALFRRVFAPVPTWRVVRSRADRELEHSVAEVNAAVERFVAEARARLAADPSRAERPHNLLEAMLVAAAEPGSGIDDAQVAGNVLTMLLAGEDTTANTVAWMIHLMWRHRHTLERATREVRAVCGDGAAVTMEQIAQLDYVDACAHETMRLKPVGPLLPLEALRATTVGGVQLLPGMVAMCLMRVDALDDRHVPAAAQFEPERWVGEGGPTQRGGAAKRVSMPFGAGPRICPGRYLALLEMKVAMATLLGRFDILSVDTPDGQEARELLQFTMMPVGLTMRLQARA
jgi:cytochrome P450